MVETNGNPQIFYFGLWEFNWHPEQGHIKLWMAPEVIYKPAEKLDKSLDIYSFAMLMVKVGYRSFLWPTRLTVDSCHQVLTGNDPFHNLPSQITGRDILKGKRPSIKNGTVPDVLLQLMKQCWAIEPKSRPNIEEVSKVLNELATAL